MFQQQSLNVNIKTDCQKNKKFVSAGILHVPREFKNSHKKRTFHVSFIGFTGSLKEKKNSNFKSITPWRKHDGSNVYIKLMFISSFGMVIHVYDGTKFNLGFRLRTRHGLSLIEISKISLQNQNQSYSKYC